VVKFSIEEGLGIGNWDDWDGFEKDSEEEDLDFYRKNLGASSVPNCM